MVKFGHYGVMFSWLHQFLVLTSTSKILIKILFGGLFRYKAHKDHYLKIINSLWHFLSILDKSWQAICFVLLCFGLDVNPNCPFQAVLFHFLKKNVWDSIHNRERWGKEAHSGLFQTFLYKKLSLHNHNLCAGDG